MHLPATEFRPPPGRENNTMAPANAASPQRLWDGANLAAMLLSSRLSERPSRPTDKQESPAHPICLGDPRMMRLLGPALQEGVLLAALAGVSVAAVDHSGTAGATAATVSPISPCPAAVLKDRGGAVRTSFPPC